MFYLKIIILTFINYSCATFSNFIGTHDSTLCVRKPPNTILPCNHQLEPDVQDFVKCGVETIAPYNCFVYDVDKVFEPEEIPFNLFIYKTEDKLLRTVSLSINFPQPEWKNMRFMLRNIEQPKYRICREFYLKSEFAVNITNSLFWNCLLYSADLVEENFYTLFLEDNSNAGGSYSFRIPAVNNYDIDTTNVTRWRVFFFLHQHYMESTGKLFVTLQPAPFANISYSVSLVKCLNDSTRCDANEVLQTIFINQERYSEESANGIILEMKKVILPGKYAVTVQILSPFCDKSRCEVSVSPVFELKNSYTVQILFGLLTIMLFIALLTFLVMRKIHLNYYDYIEAKGKKMDSVLFIYHADTEELFYFFQVLSQVFSEKFTVRTLLVDEHVGVMDPNDWTRHQLCNASKVLFFIPRNTTRDSATPIQHQWHCAITYFSGRFLKENQSIDTRCAAVLLPDSSPPVEGSELYSLRRFDLKRDLASLVNWLHRNSFTDNVLFWRPSAKKVSRDLAPFIKHAVDPLANRRPELPMYLCRRDAKLSFSIDHEATGLQNVDLDSLDDFSLDNIDEKIQNEFDHLIPDVRKVRFRDNDDNNAEDGSQSESSDSDDEVSLNDVTNFAT